MAKSHELRMRRPTHGQVDTEGYAVPPEAFYAIRGFDLRRGYPFTEKALATYTTGEIRTSHRVRKLVRWTDPADASYLYAACDGGLWKITAAGTFSLISTIAPGGTASRASTTVTITSIPNGTFVGVVRVGDVFYYDADGKDAGGVVSAVGIGTLTLTSYGGSATSGAFTIWRKLTDGDTWMVPAGGRLFIADGTGPLHEYGPQSDGSSTYVFRQTGVPVPSLQPILTLGSGGGLTAGAYSYLVSFESLRGEVGNPIQTRIVTATASQKCTMTAMPAAPESPRASRYRIYRTIAGSETGWFHLTKDITDKATAISAAGVVTLATGGLTASAHVYRRLKFMTSGTSYEITANAAGTVTVSSAAFAAESATDDVYIYGGYLISSIQTASATFVDYSTDDDLDTWNEAPTDNDEPPVALKNLVHFQGGGRIGGTVGSLFYCSGRSPTAAKQGLSDLLASGLGEFGYWIDPDRAFDIGQETGVDVKDCFEFGNTLYGVTSNDTWWFKTLSRDMLDYQWFVIAHGVGCLEGKTVAVLTDAAYWLGTIGQEIDVIRFDGQTGVGRLRRHNRALLGSIYNYSEATGVAWKGRYYLSYDSDDGGTNDRTLRYDLATQGVDTQAWGCGVFCNPYVSGETTYLYCGAPTTVGHIYQVEGAAQNLGSDATRLLETGDLHFDDPEHPPKWTHLGLTVIVEA